MAEKKRLLNIDKTISNIFGVCGIIITCMGLVLACLNPAPGGKNIITTAVCLTFMITYSLVNWSFNLYKIYNLSVVIVVCGVIFPFIFHFSGRITGSFVFYFFVAPVCYGIVLTKRRFVFIPMLNMLLFMYLIYTDYGKFVFERARFPMVMAFMASYLFVFFVTFYFNHLTRQYSHQLSRLVFEDDLTGLYNRRKFSMDVDELNFKNAAIIDIDDFKKVNDEYGHNFGDMVLKKIAGILETVASDEFRVYRYDGEKFFILSNFGRARTYLRVLQIRRLIKENTEVTVTIVTQSKMDYQTTRLLARKVEEQLYAVKKDGGDAVYDNGRKREFESEKEEEDDAGRRADDRGA